ncbi:MAG TPA: NAD(P)-dependent oxidoreductase [Prolixibacteraceae bacterium]|nr:NAD(P)-dependent oxidoreductase [Prolixibacteraceae bacterium]
MKLGILREEKTPPDKRVPLTPAQCVEVQKKFRNVKMFVQSSRLRCFNDEDYIKAGIQVQEDLSGCDVILGVKEVRAENLIPGKIYFFFSHTIKKQEYNRKLLQEILKKKVQLVDYEVITDTNGFRIIGFGRYAGLVGAYNGLRAFGLRSRLFNLPPANTCFNLDEMLKQLKSIKLPPIKIAVTGDGRVANGIVEILEFMEIQQLTPYSYLKIEKPENPVFVQLHPQNYVQHKENKEFDLLHFFNHPERYKNAFLPFARTTDMLIAGAYWDPKAPVLFTADEMKDQAFRIRVISDITCDIEGSIPSTKKASSIDDPFYDYNPTTGQVEPPFSDENNITVQAVDNLPCELPRDASVDFGRNIIDKVFPALLGKDEDGIIQRASITKNGQLTDRFLYLRDFVNEGK